MAMEPEELRKLLKKAAFIGSFFALALVFYLLDWRTALVAYIIFLGLVAVLAILLQAGRGGGLAASLGGFGADSLLGARSAEPIAKVTYVLLALFIFIAILAARMGAAPPEASGLLPELPPMEAPIGGFELPPLDDGAPINIPADPPAAAAAAEAETEVPTQDD